MRGMLGSGKWLCEPTGRASQLPKRYQVEGSPTEFVQRALDLVAGSSTIFMSLPSNVILTTRPDATAFTKSSWDLPSVEVDGSTLEGRQHGVLMDTHDQIALFELLSQIADLAQGAPSPVSRPRE
jgi:hypothetical protein